MIYDSPMKNLIRNKQSHTQTHTISDALKFMDKGIRGRGQSTHNHVVCICMLKLEIARQARTSVPGPDPSCTHELDLLEGSTMDNLRTNIDLLLFLEGPETERRP